MYLRLTLCHHRVQQTAYLKENIERFAFNTNNNIRLYLLKQELHQQIQNFPIFLTADGYFTINRSFLAGVIIQYDYENTFQDFSKF